MHKDGASLHIVPDNHTSIGSALKISWFAVYRSRIFRLGC